MTVCSVKVCKNRSGNVNLKSKGITYHRFPTDAKIKEQWIAATGRSNDWFPTKTSTICSEHFKETNFQITKKSRRLFPWAVPTINLRLVFKPNTTAVTSNAQVTEGEICNQETIHSTVITMDRSTVMSTGTSEIKEVKPFLTMTEQAHGEALRESREFPAKNLDDDTCPVQFSGQSVVVTEDHIHKITSPEKNSRVPLVESPRKRKLLRKIDQYQVTLKRQRTQIKNLQKKNCRYRKKIGALQDVLVDLKAQNLVTCDQANQLGNMGVNDLIKRYEQNIATEQPVKAKYSPALRTFACTLHFYSPKAYDYVRQKFDTCLPHSRTIKKWYESVDASPGFTKESFEAIKLKVQNTDYKVFGNLVMDEMSIRQRIEWDGKEMHGYVDICHNGTKGDHLPEAKQALVFMVTAINAPWKIPVGYFLVDGVTGEQRANLVKQCLELLDDAGIEVTSLTFDGCPANLSMAKELGCNLLVDNLRTDFAHPSNERPLYIYPDPCHMLKLVRNAFEAFDGFLDNSNRKIEWRHVKELNELQEKEMFHLGNKLRRAHIYFKNQKMKVKLASQLFSNSVADALTVCNFQENDGTVTFLKVINNLFDVLNSRHMAQLDFKKPICPFNKEKIFSFLDDTEAYLQNLKLLDGTKVVKSTRKTGFVGFLVCIKSLKAMYLQLVEKDQVLRYLPVYKISQDHLELMFGQIRAHGGCSTNPTARQFQAIYKKLMVRSELRDVEQGNCMSLEKVAILTCSSAVENINRTADLQKLYVDDDDDEAALVATFEQALFDEEIDILVETFSEFSLHAITYIAGFVAHALLKRIKCEICANVLITDEKNDDKHAFIKLKDKGGLKYPKDDVITICKKMEAVIKKSIICDEKIQANVKTIKKELISKALPLFIGLNLFEEINFHQFEQAPMNNHLTLLIKAVMEKYLDIRLHYLTKNAVPKLSRRQVLNKYLHFTGQ